MKSVPASHLAAAIRARVKITSPAAPRVSIDHTADAFTLTRELLKRELHRFETLDPDSPRVGPTVTNLRQFIKELDDMERSRAGSETPDQAIERKRRDDGETRERILQYVEQAEIDAARFGVCIHCGSELTPEKITELYGDIPA